jgi:hypothetical protein
VGTRELFGSGSVVCRYVVVTFWLRPFALITKVFAGHEDAMERAMRGLSRTERATLTDLLSSGVYGARVT